MPALHTSTHAYAQRDTICIHKKGKKGFRIFIGNILYLTLHKHFVLELASDTC